MKIALIQLNPTVGDFRANVERILRSAAEAGAQGADLAVFPELALPGYPPQDLIENEHFLKAAEDALRQVAEATSQPGMPAILCGSVMQSQMRPGKRACNVAALCYDGEVQFVQT
ncbi:MAG: nitrilase-related carbon-nitrogen hydrolase, partial [Janthinobacterium lividum]